MLIERIQLDDVTQRKQTISLKCINLLFFIMESDCVCSTLGWPVSVMHCQNPTHYIVLYMNQISVLPSLNPIVPKG
jgi:hypothetical protein